MIVNQEHALIGSILLAPADSFEAIETLGLTPADLVHSDTRLMFKELLSMQAKGEPIEAASLSMKMPEHFKMNVWDVTGSVAAPAAEFYGQAVMDSTKRKELADLGDQLIKGSADSGSDLEKLQDLALSTLSQTKGKGVITQSQTLRQAAARVMDDLDNPPKFIPTPWPALNGIIGGLRPGSMYVIAARPGVGKSLLALQLAEAIATPEHQVAFFSLEMNSDELATRALARKAGISIGKIDSRDLSEQDKEKLAHAYKDLNHNLHLIGTPSREVSQLRPTLRNIQRQSGNSLGAVFIDYLGLMDVKGTSSLYEKVTAISGQLKSLAMELNVPFVVLSQLNRKSVDRAGPPGLADLRDSGSVEQDADVVLMLSNEQANTLSLSIQKNRQGPEALLRGRIDRSTMKLLELVKA